MQILFTKPTVTAAMPTCDLGCESGFIAVSPSRAESCKCRAARRSANLFNHAMLPASLFPAVDKVLRPPNITGFQLAGWRRAHRQLGRLVDAAVEREAGRYADPGFVSIRGNSGAGKSFLLAAMVRRAAELQVGVAYIDVGDAFAAIKRFGAGSLEVGTQLLSRVPLLAIDSVGEHRNAGTSNLARDLILARKRDGMCTAASTLLPTDRLATEFGQVIADLFGNAVPLSNGSLRW